MELQPDLVLASSLTPPNVVERLESLGLPFCIRPSQYQRSDRGHRKGGDNIRSRRQRERAKRSHGRGGSRGERQGFSSFSRGATDSFHLLWHDPLWTAGKDTFVNEFITIAGGQNAFADLSGYVIVDLEELIRRNPNIITVVEDHGEEGSLSYQFLLSDSRLKVVNAIQNHKVFPVDSDIASRSSARVVDAVRIFASIIHPEIFGEYEYQS